MAHKQNEPRTMAHISLDVDSVERCACRQVHWEETKRIMDKMSEDV